MNRRLAVLAILLAAALALPAQARENVGRIGVGFEPALGGTVSSMTLVFPASPTLDLQTLLGGGFAIIENQDPALQLGLGLRGLYRAASLGAGLDLVVLAGAAYEMQSTTVLSGFVPARALDHVIHLEAGLRPEWFATEWLSLHTQAGVALSVYVAQTGANTSPDRAASLGTVTNLVGQAGFTLWF